MRAKAAGMGMRLRKNNAIIALGPDKYEQKHAGGGLRTGLMQAQMTPAGHFLDGGQTVERRQLQGPALTKESCAARSVWTLPADLLGAAAMVKVNAESAGKNHQKVVSFPGIWESKPLQLNVRAQETISRSESSTAFQGAKPVAQSSKRLPYVSCTAVPRPFILPVPMYEHCSIGKRHSVYASSPLCIEAHACPLCSLSIAQILAYILLSTRAKRTCRLSPKATIAIPFHPFLQM